MGASSLEGHKATQIHTLVFANWVSLTRIWSVPLPAQFCLSWIEFRGGFAAKQDSGSPNSKSTQPNSATTWDVLCHKGHMNFCYCSHFTLQILKNVPLWTHSVSSFPVLACGMVRAVIVTGASHGHGRRRHGRDCMGQGHSHHIHVDKRTSEHTWANIHA